MKSLAAIGALLAIAAVGPPASAHTLSAQGGGVTCYNGIPCDATHIDGNFEIGVPGVNPNYFYIHTSADSDNGHMSIASALSWLEGARPGNTNHLADGIEENVVLERIDPGPVTVRATLELAGGGNAVGTGNVTLNGSVSVNGCQIYADKIFTAHASTDLDPTGAPCGGELIGSTLVVTQTWDGNLPTSPYVSASIGADYNSVTLGTVIDFQWEGDLRVELINVTADWDTLTFLTQVPEPDADALALVCFAVLGVRARRRASLTAKAAPTRGTPRRGRAATRPA
jgi:hypothetical protein